MRYRFLSATLLTQALLISHLRATEILLDLHGRTTSFKAEPGGSSDVTIRVTGAAKVRTTLCLLQTVADLRDKPCTIKFLTIRYKTTGTVTQPIALETDGDFKIIDALAD